MRGKLKVKGNMGLAMKLGTVIKAAAASKPAAAAAPSASTLQSAALFKQIADAVASDGASLVKQVSMPPAASRLAWYCAMCGAHCLVASRVGGGVGVLR